MDIYTLQAGEKLNKKQFLEYFEKKVRKTIRTHKLIGKKEKLFVACSGGKDSTATLYLLHKIYKDNKDIKIEAIHVDPNIGAYCKVNKQNLIKFCSDHKIPLHLYSYKEEFGHTLCYIRDKLEEKGAGQKSCSICGVLRRHVLNKKAREHKATLLVMGHNLDDEAQNIMMNMFQNRTELLSRLGPRTGLKDHKGFIPRIKPLYFCAEEEIKLFTQTMGFPIHYERCPCSSDAFRKDVSELLNNFEKDHKSVKSGIIRSYLELLPKLKKESSGDVNYCSSCGEPSSGPLCRACKILDTMSSA